MGWVVRADHTHCAAREVTLPHCMTEPGAAPTPSRSIIDFILLIAPAGVDP